MNRTEYFSETVCRKAMIFAIVSACFGAVSQIVFRESSIIILYASKLGADRFLTLSSTSIQLLCICVFQQGGSDTSNNRINNFRRLSFCLCCRMVPPAQRNCSRETNQPFFRSVENELAGSGDDFSGLFSFFHWKRRIGQNTAGSDCRYRLPDSWKIVPGYEDSRGAAFGECPGIL